MDDYALKDILQFLFLSKLHPLSLLFHLLQDLCLLLLLFLEIFFLFQSFLVFLSLFFQLWVHQLSLFFSLFFHQSDSLRVFDRLPLLLLQFKFNLSHFISNSLSLDLYLFSFFFESPFSLLDFFLFLKEPPQILKSWQYPNHLNHHHYLIKE